MTTFIAQNQSRQEFVPLVGVNEFDYRFTGKDSRLF
jgi:hypothetical protein